MSENAPNEAIDSSNDLGSGSARVSDPVATPDRRSPVAGTRDTSATPAAAQSVTDGELQPVSLVLETSCDDDSILRNEPNEL
jgi:hypothetical protein